VRAEYGTTARVVTAPISYSAVGNTTDKPKSSLRQVHPDNRTADSRHAAYKRANYDPDIWAGASGNSGGPVFTDTSIYDPYAVGK
jgi:hypothetical protein